MDLSSLSQRVVDCSLAFAWDEWAQLGVLATPHRKSPWAQDPEALILFTLEVAREEPRLFDEMLDWMLVNEQLLSVRRLRALCVDEEDRRLSQATMSWLGSLRPRARLRGGANADRELRETLFRFGGPIGRPDEAFAAHGFVRPHLAPSGKSQRPDLFAPINFSFRMRQILGIGARAEIVRVLLTIDAPQVNAQTLARSTGYAKRNVHDAATALADAGAISMISLEGEHRYSADRDAWARLLHDDADSLPQHRDWPQLLGVVRRILRWLQRRDREHVSEYVQASQARDLLELIVGDLAFAGIPVDFTPTPDGIWRDFSAVVENLTSWLAAPADERPHTP